MKIKSWKYKKHNNVAETIWQRTKTTRKAVRFCARETGSSEGVETIVRRAISTASAPTAHGSPPANAQLSPTCARLHSICVHLDSIGVQLNSICVQLDSICIQLDSICVQLDWICAQRELICIQTWLDLRSTWLDLRLIDSMLVQFTYGKCNAVL